MGEKQTKPFQLSFNGLLKVDFQGSHVTSDGGLILVRELDERLGLGKLIDEYLSDSRQGLNKKFPLADLLRQSVYSRLAGYEDLNDAVRVSADPTFRLIGSQRNWDRRAALTSTLHGFETEILASEENLLGLMALNRELVGQAEAFDDSERVVLDMDSTESPVHGQQEGSAYNGHFESVCYHPLLLFNQHGDCLAAKLRPGNVHSAEDWNELLLPEIERQQAAGKQVAFRGDAAFAKPEVYESSEERGVQYAIRIPANRSLELEIEDILFRPPGRPSRKPLVRYKSFRYQAESWSKARRIVAKVEHKISQWVNPSAFAHPAPFTFGTTPRLLPSCRIDGIKNFDITIIKHIPIKESVRAEFRAEFFNAFNRPQFGAPNMTFGSGSFGQVTRQENLPRVIQLALKIHF